MSVFVCCFWIVLALLASSHILESVMETISQPLEEIPNLKGWNMFFGCLLWIVSLVQLLRFVEHVSDMFRDFFVQPTCGFRWETWQSRNPPKQFGPICIHFGCITVPGSLSQGSVKSYSPQKETIRLQSSSRWIWGVNLWSERCFWGLVGRGVYRLKKHIYIYVQYIYTYLYIYIDIHVYFSCHIWVFLHGAYKNRCHICIDTWCI